MRHFCWPNNAKFNFHFVSGSFCFLRKKSAGSEKGVDKKLNYLLSKRIVFNLYVAFVFSAGTLRPNVPEHPITPKELPRAPVSGARSYYLLG